MRCVSISWVDITGHCKVEIPVTHCCVIDLVDVGDRVPGSSGKREKNRWKRLSCVACEICGFVV